DPGCQPCADESPHALALQVVGREVQERALEQPAHVRAVVGGARREPAPVVVGGLRPPPGPPRDRRLAVARTRRSSPGGEAPRSLPRSSCRSARSSAPPGALTTRVSSGTVAATRR